MRIEKISDTQVKFILTLADLAERNINITELSQGSEKTQQLFHEMMRQAMTECEFETDNMPLMVEAVSIGQEGVMVVVTKLSDTNSVDPKLSFLPLEKSALRFKRKDFIEPSEDRTVESISVFSFDSLDTLTDAAARLSGRFKGVSGVYKLYGRYFLMLQNETEDARPTADIEAVLYEYGQKHVSKTISRQYLVEHGETLIACGAVEKLALAV